jgi:hypothetical protein
MMKRSQLLFVSDVEKSGVFFKKVFHYLESSYSRSTVNRMEEGIFEPKIIWINCGLPFRSSTIERFFDSTAI